MPLRFLCDAITLLCNTPAKPLRCPCARDCNSYPTDSSATPLGRLLSADYINRPHRLARLQGVLSTRHTPLRNDQCALHVLLGSGTGDRSYLLGGTGRPVMRTTGTGADRCSVAGTGGGGRILENPRRWVSPPSDATAVTAPVCPVFRVVVAGRYLVCRFN